MPFYLRKSIRAGPFRFNLSNSGIGVSVGVKGLRIGTGPRGHYVHAGRGGLYYRSSIRRAGDPSSRAPSAQLSYVDQPPHPPQPDLSHPTVDLVEVESGDVMDM